RLTAVIMAVYTLLAIGTFVIAQPENHAEWKALFAPGWVRVVTLLFFLSLGYHAWVGMRDILMDYAKPTGLRLFLYTAVGAALAGSAVWAVQIMWRGRAWCWSVGNATQWSSERAAPVCARRCSSRKRASAWPCGPRCSRLVRTPSPRRAASVARWATWDAI